MIKKHKRRASGTCFGATVWPHKSGCVHTPGSNRYFLIKFLCKTDANVLSHRRHVLAGICGIVAYRAPPTNRPAFPVDSVGGSEWEGRACISCHTLWVALSGQSFKVCYKCPISNVFIYIVHLHTNIHI